MGKLSVHKKLVREVFQALNVESDRTYLDAGCGTGNLLLKIAREGKARAYGIDFSMPMLKQAMRNCRKEKVILVYSNLSKRLPFKDEFFDGIACVHALYLLDNPSFTLQEFHRVLKKGSKLVLVNPSIAVSKKSLLDREYMHADGLIYLTHLPSCLILALLNILMFRRITLRKTSFAAEAAMESLLRQLSFKILEVKPVYEDTSSLILVRK
jgi:ubiquinone/menaquinone biosynthesis C-methylase UbiE